MGEPGGLPSMGSHRVRHDWSDLAAAAAVSKLLTTFGEKQGAGKDWVFGLTYTHCWEKAMAPHSSTLAWKIPWMVEPGRLKSMGSQRVGHD